MNGSKVENLVRLEGVLCRGYGMTPSLVVRDERLSIEAKGIYSYIATFARDGITAFPAVELMVKELCISEDRFYRHRKLLIDFNYITVERIRTENGKWLKNLYTLVQNPNPLPKKMEENQVESGSAPDGAENSALGIDGVDVRESAPSDISKSVASINTIEGETATDGAVEDSTLPMNLEEATLEEAASAFAIAGGEVYEAVSNEQREFFSFACQMPAMRENALEILESMNDALIMSRATMGYKYKKKCYTYSDLADIFRQLTTSELDSIRKSIHKEFGYQNIRNRSTYIIGCIFKAHAQRSNKHDSS